MIEAHELRIGNWLFYDSFNLICQVKGFYFNVDDLRIIHTWKEDNILTVHETEEKYFSPIPLTPEILEKAGLVKEISIGKDWSNDGDEIITYKNKKGNLRIVGSRVFYGIFARLELIKDDLKHLHQLQNLFYCLCGKELEINLHVAATI